MRILCRGDFFKKFAYPDVGELKLIISTIKEFSPDLIVAIGGGSVLDYAKISNVLTNNSNLDEEIINSSYKIEKKFTVMLYVTQKLIMLKVPCKNVYLSPLLEKLL